MSADGPSEPKRQAHIIKTKGVKRKQPTVYHGSNTVNIDLMITCSVCFNLMESPYVTECGHSFCYSCITQSLENVNKCPRCSFTTNTSLKIFPNLTLNAVIAQHKSKLRNSHRALNGISSLNNITDLVNGGSEVTNSVTYQQVDSLIDLLKQKRDNLLFETEIGQAHLTLEFLNEIKEAKEEKLRILQHELSVISKDISEVSLKSSELEKQYSESRLSTPTTDDVISDSHRTSNSIVRQRISTHSTDLHELYFSMRSKAMLDIEENDNDDDGLKKFTEALTKFVKYKGFRQLATLNYTNDMYNMYSIVSSIEFDKDSDYFAIAGVTKKIKVYDYKQVVTDVVDVHYPISEMACGSKISCLAWNPYHKNQLVSSDYEGCVTMWDPFTSKKIHTYQEHEKRCWCVDFNKLNPYLMASGSDDSKVKLWSTKTTRSVLNIDAVANVCCVKFNPESAFHLAFGAADHCVHYYDLRKTNEALLTFKGHSKAVSYAKFLNGEEIVSASTDSQLKLWNVTEGTNTVRTFKGHMNERNFVGLASESDYIACGSEDNSLCIYYKGLSKVLHQYKFEVARSAWQRDTARDEDSTEFVSAVSWMSDSGVVVVANSQGIVKVLELI